MRLKVYTRTIPGMLTAGDCARVLALVGGDEGVIAPTAEAAWLYARLDAHVHAFNDANWRWDLGRGEAVRVVARGPDEPGAWTMDSLRRPYRDGEPFPGMIRKLTVVVRLDDPDACQGGDMQIEWPHGGPFMQDKRIETLAAARARGAGVIYPAHLYHRFLPITAGVRLDLVRWYAGPIFR